MEGSLNPQGGGALSHEVTETEVVVAGGGISGICMAIKLIEAGITKIVIIEKSAGFGGTWRDNRYPGCRCDVPAHLYSFSFAGNPDWSRVYPAQIEILAYLTKVATKYDLFQYIRFCSEVEGAVWNDTESKWKVTVKVLGSKDAEFESSYSIITDFLVSAVGQLNVPYTPNLPGLKTFKGKIMHSARWNLATDLQNLRIGIIGNGATAIQIVPEIAKISSQLTLFLRTPNWVMPRDDEEYQLRTKFVLQNVPMARSIYRSTLMRRGESFWVPLTQLGTDAAAQLRKWCLGHMQSQLPGREDLWGKITPTYTPGCKRILISNDFYPALLRENVKVETSAIERIAENSIHTTDGMEYQIDCLILATGFQTEDLLSTFSIQGCKSQSLQMKWKQDGVHALYGIGVEDMPNFGMLYGPNTNLAHNSIILMIEAQARYIQHLVSKVVNARRVGQYLTITPKASRVKEYNGELQKQLLTTSFADPRCNSWYKTAEGTVTNNWGRNVVEYQDMLSTVQWSDYDLIGYESTTLSGISQSIGRVSEEKIIKSIWPVTLMGILCSGLVVVLFG